MTIDEALERHKEDCKRCRDKACEHNHRCLQKKDIEVYEELKEARKGFEENRKAGYKHGYSDGYNKAIDEFVKRLYKIGEHREFDWEDIYRLADRMKEGTE